MPQSQTIDTVGERRRKLRIDCAFPAIVRGHAPDGNPFAASAVLKNFSACGLYLRLDRQVEPDRELFILVRLSQKAQNNKQTHSIAIRGIVVRSELQSDGIAGIAVRFLRYRLL